MIKKLILLSMFIILCIHTAPAEQTILLTSGEIESILQANGYNDFMKKTNIVSNLSSGPKFPQGIVIAVQLALHDFYLLTKQDNYPIKSEIVRALLQEHPQTLKQLEEKGLLN